MSVTNWGYDPGFGNGNGSNHMGNVTVPALVALKDAKQISEDSMGTDKNAPSLIEIDDSEYYVGLGSRLKGKQVTNLNHQRLLDGSNTMRSMMYATFAKNYKSPGARTKKVSMGCALPVRLIEGDKLQNTKDSMNEWLIGQHQFKCNGSEWKMNVEYVTYMSQPMAIFFSEILDAKGGLRPDREEWLNGQIGIISIGMNDLMIFTLDSGLIDQSRKAYDEFGVNWFLNLFSGSFQRNDEALRKNPRANKFQKPMTDWTDKLWELTRKAWGSDGIEELDAVIVAGGGTLLCGDVLRDQFGEKLIVPDKPIESVSVGAYRRMLADA